MDAALARLFERFSRLRAARIGGQPEPWEEP